MSMRNLAVDWDWDFRLGYKKEEAQPLATFSPLPEIHTHAQVL